MDEGDYHLAGLVPSRPLGVRLRPRPELEKKMDAGPVEDPSSESFTDLLLES